MALEQAAWLVSFSKQANTSPDDGQSPPMNVDSEVGSASS
jgi:hypothetical protein